MPSLPIQEINDAVIAQYGRDIAKPQSPVTCSAVASSGGDDGSAILYHLVDGGEVARYDWSIEGGKIIVTTLTIGRYL
jgi:hypothetical protein